MKRFFFLSVWAALCCAACGSDKSLDDDTGVSQASWTAEVFSKSAGQTHLFSFAAGGAWEAASSQTWCAVTPAAGVSGMQCINVVTSANDTGRRRTAVVSVRVKGYSASASFRITQHAEGGDDAAVDEWVAEYMRENYLWNEPIAELKLDYALNYRLFLNSILQGVASFKDAEGRDLNYDDGHWKNGRREQFYSYIVKTDRVAAYATRSAGERTTGTGLWRLSAVVLSHAGTEAVGFAILGVVPGTSAAEAGLERGMFISEVDGQKVTRSNYQALALRLYEGASVKALPNRVIWDADGNFRGLDPLPAATLKSQSYVDPAVYRSAVTTVGGKRTAYLLYMGFETSEDDALIAAFREFRGVEELILDLRYNGGGAVRSSTLLATLIAGEAYKDAVYCRMAYNARRTAAGKKGVYRIGDSRVPDGNGTYTPIAAALSSGLGLKRIHVLCSESTASASELVINGLRGLGIEVRLIGSRTNGKNVGMEGYVDHVVGADMYTFMPITFYSENAVGFRDYSDGFVPDIEVAEGPIYERAYYPGDFGTSADPLYALAAEWIAQGEKPVVTRAGAALRRARTLPGIAARPDRRLKGSVVFLDE